MVDTTTDPELGFQGSGSGDSGLGQDTRTSAAISRNGERNREPNESTTSRRLWTPKRFRRKVSHQRTALQIATRKYMEENKSRILDEWIGYPQLATFQTMTSDFSLYRGFRYLHARVLLDLQDEVAVLERELNDLDHDDNQGDTDRQRTLRSRAFDMWEAKKQQGSRTRRDVLKEIRAKLLEYDEMLFKARDVAAIRKPSDGDHRNVKQWLWDNKPLLEVGDEADFVNWRDDLVTLQPKREWAAIDGILFTLLRWFNVGFIQNIFRTVEQRAKVGGDHGVELYAPERIEAFVNMLVTPLLCTMLLVLPVVAMYALNISGDRSAYQSAVVVLIFFTLLFAGSMPLFTKARRNEIFAASAAYCAVLVVFISNFSTDPHIKS